MILRVLLWGVLFWLVASVVRQMLRSGSAGAGGGGAGAGMRREAGRGPETARYGGLMVRDRICDTYFPRERALVEHDDAGEHYFCSEACRRTWRERERARAAH